MMTPSKWKLRSWRQDNQLTQGDAAAKVPVSRKTWNEWENCKTRPGEDMMERLFVITDGAVTPNDFYNLPTLTIRKAA